MTDRETVANETAARALLPFLDDEARFGIEDLAKFSGIPTESLLDFWRALGFPEPRPGEQLFTDSDVEMLSTIVGLIADGSVEPETARQFARVIGWLKRGVVSPWSVPMKPRVRYASDLPTLLDSPHKRNSWRPLRWRRSFGGSSRSLMTSFPSSAGGSSR
jgi:hypothetical protein